MQDDRVTVRLDVEDCVREQVAGYSQRQIPGQLPAVQLFLCAVVIVMNALSEIVRKYSPQRVDHSFLALNRAFGLGGRHAALFDRRRDEQAGMDLMQSCRIPCIPDAKGV